MKTGNILTLKKLVLNLLLILFMTSCASRPGKIEFINHPDFKAGFTTQNFIYCLPVTVENSKMLLDYASEKGFTFFELRDPNAVLSYEECKEIAEYARKKNIDVAYANQRGLLDPDFWDIFRKGVRNASAFTGPKTIRATISGLNFTENPAKTGLTADEFAIATDIANKAADEAEKNGLQLVIENGNEILTESSDSIYGFESVINNVNNKIAWQFDTANPFYNKNTYVNPDSVKKFLAKYGYRISYVHLKSSKDYKSQKILTQNDLDFSEILKTLSEENVKLIAIELLADSSRTTAFENMEKSLDYLKREGFIK